jgi:hypothetical protein
MRILGAPSRPGNTYGLAVSVDEPSTSSPLACRMTLPLGSSDGLYYVRVQRAVQSESLKTAHGNATIHDGDVRLDVELDLSNVSARRYLLSYRHTGDSWHRVPIVITN